MSELDELELYPVSFSADELTGPKLRNEVYTVASMRELRNTWSKTSAGAMRKRADLASLDDESTQRNLHAKDLKQFDINSNGKLDDSELKHAMERATTVEELLRFDDLYLYDKNRDGLINGKEATKRDGDIQKSRDAQFKNYDTNSDGTFDNNERKRQIEDLLDAQKKPLSEKDLKEKIAEATFDLRANFENGDMSALMLDIYRANEKMRKVQFEKFLKAVNDEYHKINPHADIIDVAYSNRFSMRVTSRDGKYTAFLDSRHVEFARKHGKP